MEPTAKSKIEKICYCNCGINLAAASVLALLLWMAADFRESKQQPAASTPHGCGSLGNERNLYRSRGPFIAAKAFEFLLSILGFIRYL